METRNVNGDILSNEVFEDKENLVDAFDAAMDNSEVKTIKVNKDIKVKEKITDVRRNVVEKQMRKLRRKLDVLNQELNQG